MSQKLVGNTGKMVTMVGDSKSKYLLKLEENNKGDYKR